MIVPEFWAEARRQQPRAKGRQQITVRRFGWSDISQADAERMADERVRAAFDRVVAGEKLQRHEPKIGYNGATGVPIREEILSRHGDTVISRNSYGARCLNTPDVLFADVDFAQPKGIGCGPSLALATIFAAVPVAIGIWLRSRLVAVGGGVLALMLAAVVTKSWEVWRRRSFPDPEPAARARIAAFAREHPDWHLRVYRTPAGLRVLVMHQTFDPTATATVLFFAALEVDRVYAQMCRNQACFRARVSPKPWRIGVGGHIRPRPGVWPVNPAMLPVRNEWIHRYEEAAAGWASCRFVESIGSSAVHPKAAAVRELHDQLSQALSGREIA